ncbi:hypothetical protein [Sorangium sp. So ce1151]|uniref:hypothetical protein n=1 Tax=Sorangium sp. So ce1151 TaxID=3133332 RepID=UPI003F60C4FC
MITWHLQLDQDLLVHSGLWPWGRQLSNSIGVAYEHSPSLCTFTKPISGGSCHVTAPAVIRSVSSAKVRFASWSGCPTRGAVAERTHGNQRVVAWKRAALTLTR